MGNAGNGTALLAAYRGHQRPGGQKQHMVEFSHFQLPHEIPTTHGSGAAAAAASGMDILGFEIKDQTAAVLVYGGDIDLLLDQKLVKQLGAYLPQIPGEDAVVLVGLGAGILEKGEQGGGGSGSHGRPHVVDVVNS